MLSLQAVSNASGMSWRRLSPGRGFGGHLATLNMHRVVPLRRWFYRRGDVCGVSEACEILVRLSVYRIAVAQAFAA